MTERVIVSIDRKDVSPFYGITPLMRVYEGVMENVLDDEELIYRCNNYSMERMIDDINDTKLELQISMFDVNFSEDYIPDWLLLLDNLIELDIHRYNGTKLKEFKIFDWKWNEVRNFSLKKLTISGKFKIKHLNGELIQYFTPFLTEIDLPGVGLESINIPANVRELDLRDNLIRTIEWPTRKLKIERLFLQNNRIFIRNPANTKDEYEEHIHSLTQEQDDRYDDDGYFPGSSFYELYTTVPYEGDGPVPVLDPKVFSEMKNLKILNLSRNWMIEWINLDDFKQCEYLDLRLTSLSEIVFTSETSDLQFLDITDTPLDETDVEEIQEQYPYMDIKYTHV